MPGRTPESVTKQSLFEKDEQGKVLAKQPETPGGNHLGEFKLVSQKPQTNWCWAANSDAVSGFYGDRLKKCRVVRGVLSTQSTCQYEAEWGAKNRPTKDGKDDCCQVKWPLTDDTDPCASRGANGYTDRRARVVCGLLAVKHYKNFDDPLKLDDVKNEIDTGRPLIMQVRWDLGGGQHYVAITGYDDKGNINIADPMSDSLATQPGHWTTMHIGDVGDQYHAPEGGAGTWIGTALTVKKQT